MANIDLIEMLLNISANALKLTLILSAPALGLAMLVGLFISLIQATTQIQEQTLTFVPKLIVVTLVLAFTGYAMMEKLQFFTKDIFDQMDMYLQKH